MPWTPGGVDAPDIDREAQDRVAATPNHEPHDVLSQRPLSAPMTPRASWERLADPAPRDRRRLLAFAALSLAAVFALRWVVTNPLLPATSLYFISVVAAAIAYGFRGGLVASITVAGVYVLWSAVHGPDLGAGQIALRTGALVVPYVAFSWVLGMFLRTHRARLRSVIALEGANERLERSNRDLERSNHDLEQRAGPKLGEQERHFVTGIRSATGRMHDLIDDILTWSTAGSAPMTLVELDVDDVIGEVRGALGAALTESGGTVETTDLPVVRADPRQLRQLFQNLLSNALKFRAGAPPRVGVRADPIAGGWRFQVRDNGIGVPPDQAERIFGMFERVQANGGVPGTGIGLSICQTVVQRHGGEIWIEPTPGGGTTFCFTLRTAGAELPA